MTPRLVGKPHGMADLAAMRRLHSDPQVMATLAADGLPLSEAQTRASLSAGDAHWRRYGFGVWMFHTHHDAQFVGYAGLKHTNAGGADEVELLYAVGSWAWRRGYAVEMARAAIDAAFGRLRLIELVGFTLPHNLASRRVLERMGFRYEREIIHAGLPHVFYRLRADVP